MNPTTTRFLANSPALASTATFANDFHVAPSGHDANRNNHIHDVDANHYGGWGIYHDEGSTHLLVENNVVYWREGELLSKNWKDVPYTFHAHPKDKSGTQTLTNTFEFDWNLYFNPAKKRDEVQWAGGTWAEWQQRGKDRHSQYADPLFANPDQGDFTLCPESSALALGFQPIDLGQVGPRSRPSPITPNSEPPLTP